MFTNWAKESSTLRVSRLMLEVVLNDWVIDTKDTPSPEHHGRADERHGWKGLANNHFSFATPANVWRGGSGIRANAGNVDQLPDARFSGEPRDSCGSCYMDGMEGLLAALHIETHGVHDALNSHHGSGNGAIIIDVGMDRLDAEPNVGEKGFGAFRMPRRDSYRKFAREQMLDDVAAEKASPAEYGHLPSCHRSVPWPMPSCRSAASPQSGRQQSADGWLLSLPNDKSD
jgi:hypothetical protein